MTDKQIATNDRSTMNSVAISTGANGSSLAPQSLADVVRFAEVMCRADIALPKHLRGNAGACMAVAMQALEWQMSPFAVASKSYAVNGAIAYEAQLIAAVVNTRSGIKGRLKYVFEGDGADMTCTVSGLLDGDECTYTSPPIGQIPTKNSPLWKSDPQQQLGYFSARSWARRHCPEVILGVYDRDEAQQFQGPDNAKDVTPSVMQRLQAKQIGSGPLGGFDADHVTRETETLTGEPEIEYETSPEAPRPESNGSGDPAPDAAAGQSSSQRAAPGEARRFYESVVLNHDADECLKWPFGCDRNGYGQVWIDGKTQYVHRLVCAEEHGPAPSDDMYATHTCGKGHEGCCSRRHVRWGTPSENQLDRAGHGTELRGERNSAAKLTPELAAEIRRNPDNLTFVQLAERYGVSQNTINAVITGQRWTDEAGGDNAPVSEPADRIGLTDQDRTWLKDAARMLWAATGKGEQELLKNTFDGIREHHTPDSIAKAARDKGNSIYKQCKLVCFGEADSADTLELISGIAGVEPKELVG